MEVITIKFDFDIKRLQSLVDDFYLATGIRIYIISNEFVSVKDRSTDLNTYSYAIKSADEKSEVYQTSDMLLLNRCKNSGKPEIQVLHGGLVNIVAPICYDGETVGYVFFFSLRREVTTNEEFLDPSLEEKKTEIFYEQLSSYEKKKYNSLINVAVMLCEHIILTDMIKPSMGEIFQMAKRFIKDNLSKELSGDEIAKGVNISKSTLYRLFAKRSGCTVSEYVNKKRMEKATELLLSTEMSISEIAEAVGFKDIGYFRSVFKKSFNCTPLKYREENSKLED